MDYKKNSIHFLIIFLFTIIILITGCSSTKKIQLSIYESVAWTRLRYAIAESVIYDGSTSLTTNDIELLKELSKKNNKSNEWFNDIDIKYIAYGKTMDTDKYQISFLCSKNYCAKFTVEKDDGDYTLINYSFVNNDIGGYTLYPIDK